MGGAYDDPPEAVRAAWTALQDVWSEPARHDAFLALATQSDAFAWAARQYRTRAGDPVADERLQKIQRAAIARLSVTAKPRPERKSPYRMFLVLLLFLLVAVFIGVLLFDTLPSKTRHTQPSHVPVQVR